MKLKIALALIFLAAASSYAVEITAKSNEAGQELAALLRNAEPEENSEITGVLKIHSRDQKIDVPVRAQVFVKDGKWKTVYTAKGVDGRVGFQVVILHSVNSRNEYLFAHPSDIPSSAPQPVPLANEQASDVFLSGSDFSVADLGLDFLHWPEQKRLNGELRLGRDCYLLESQNPNAKEMVRVKSWIDKESNGVLIAEGFNAQGELVKKFSLSGSSFKKVNGHWQLEKMTIHSPKKKSETVLQFDLPKS